MIAMTQSQSVGDLLREWRQRRRMSQLDLSLEAEISTKHLSFLETGRSQPSREMVLNLAEQLEIPLRERNVLLVAAGFAPVFAERKLEDPALQAARKAMDLVLAGHEPYPALAVDRHWTLVAANAAVGRLIAGADPALLRPPVNVLRLSLHPKGMALAIANLPEWRAHLLARLRRQIEVSADPVLAELLGELSAYPVPFARTPARPSRETRVRQRRRSPAAHDTQRPPLVLQHHHGVRHAPRHHALRAGAGVLLPRRPRHRGAAAHPRRRRLTCGSLSGRELSKVVRRQLCERPADLSLDDDLDSTLEQVGRSRAVHLPRFCHQQIGRV